MKFRGNWYEEGDDIIYLIKVEYKNETLLKIGYTSNIESRLEDYKLHNPNFVLMELRKGTRVLEGLMHKYFDSYRLPNKEWFHYSDEIVNKFYLINERGFLDKEVLKQSIKSFFNHHITGDLVDTYLEGYKSEIESKKVEKYDLSMLLVHINLILDSFLNLYFEHLDYSSISPKLDLNTEYIFLIPNPFSPDKNLEISLDQLFNCFSISSILLINNKRPKEVVKIELENKECYSITNLFNEYQKSRMNETIKKLERISPLECSEIKTFSDLHRFGYVDLKDNSGDLVIDKFILKSEQLAFDVIKKFGFKMDLS